MIPSAGRNEDPDHTAARVLDAGDKEVSPETSGCLHPAGIPEHLGNISEPHAELKTSCSHVKKKKKGNRNR